MLKEKFYESDVEHPRTESDEPDLVVQWGEEPPRISGTLTLNSRSGVNRIICSLRRARNRTFGKDE